jgi:hypothetical protein
MTSGVLVLYRKLSFVEIDLSHTLPKGVNEFLLCCTYFLTFFFWAKFGVRNLHLTDLRNSEFSDNRYGGSRNLHKGINEILAYFLRFSSDLGWGDIGTRGVHRHFLSSREIH